MEIFHSVFLVLSSMCISYPTPITENMYSYSNERIGQETYEGNYLYHNPFKERQQHDNMRHWDEGDNQAFIILDSQPEYLAPSESMKDYPFGAIRRFLEDNPRLTDYFKAKRPHIVIRFQGMRNRLPEEDEEGQTMCKIRESKVIFPQLLQNVENLWRIVINIEGEYQQGVEIKTCYRKGEECDGLKSLPFGYTSFCSQQYITKELMVFNYSKAFDLFRFPSCCLCKLKKP
ncbi:uncharacterized protein [Euwallacea fornicatus]|uniref:uncharacterized protein isoform X2 n=1 Tax=Euwallacea fornicatus TaxID=995702 RepID=UPI00338D5A8E